jgi:hypothetical protein
MKPAPSSASPAFWRGIPWIIKMPSWLSFLGWLLVALTGAGTLALSGGANTVYFWRLQNHLS